MPPNDPQWGKKNNEGPPDLDEILRKLQQKLAGLLGGARRARDPEPEMPPSGPNGASAAVFGGSVVFILLLIIAMWLASGFYI
ncbi:MAG: protease modulator HflK N-terminal domain-containing protein, partial [Burkholderiales bacterium]